MIDRIAWALLLLLHAVPSLALVRPALVTSLYGVERDAAAFPLLQHRAALFLVIAIICGWAMVDPAVRRLASVATALSMVSFLILYALAGWPAGLRAIALADLIMLPVLAVAAWRAWA